MLKEWRPLRSDCSTIIWSGNVWGNEAARLLFRASKPIRSSRSMKNSTTACCGKLIITTNCRSVLSLSALSCLRAIDQRKAQAGHEVASSTRRFSMTRFALTAVCLLLLPSHLIGGNASQSSIGSVRTYRSAHEAQIVSEFVEFLSIPNIATDSVNIDRNGSLLIEMMSRRGIQATRLTGANSPPAVFGELRTPGATRTIGF